MDIRSEWSDRIPDRIPSDTSGSIPSTAGTSISDPNYPSRGRLIPKRTLDSEIDLNEHPSPDPQTQAPERVLACPFFKLDPIKYFHCGTRNRLLTTNYVRQHLVRSHRVLYSCPVCTERFTTRHELDEHIRERSCIFSRQPGNNYAVTEAQILLISKVRRSGREDERWFDMWDILFPNLPRPKSPYLRLEGLYDVMGILAAKFFSSEHLAESLRRKVPKLDADDCETITSDVFSQLRDYLADLNLDDFLSPPDAASYTPLPSWPSFRAAPLPRTAKSETQLESDLPGPAPGLDSVQKDQEWPVLQDHELQFPPHPPENLMESSKDILILRQRYKCTFEGCDWMPMVNSKRGNWPRYLRKHRATHGPRIFSCEVCGLSFSRQDNRNAHRAKHDLGGYSPLPRSSRLQAYPTRSRPPIEPGMQESLQIPDTHGKTRESTGPANKPLVPGSSAASIDQPTLARQEDDATGVDLFVSGATSIRSCPNCPLTLFSSEDLAAHTAAYKHLCSHCPRHFVSRKDLNRHVATVHENNSTPCPITGCEYSGRQDNLRRHMRTMHGAEPENATKVAVTPSEKPGGDGDGTVSMQVDESEEDEFDADE